MTHSTFHRLTCFGVVALLGIASNCVTAAPARAEAGSGPLVRVLALGDSFSAGVGGGDYEPGPCDRSKNAWSAQWVERARARGVNIALENRACTGATMHNFYKPVRDTRRQLDYVTSDYDIVMLTIGGNDIGYR